MADDTKALKAKVDAAGYAQFLAAMKERMAHARTSAVRAVNHELALLYWDIGCGIVEKAFDLKIGAFEPEHAGKMDFYLNLLKDRERAPDDQPSIGIILCAEKDDVEVEYALKSKVNPIGVAEYQLQARLPAEFKGRLPTARQLAEVVRGVLPRVP